MSTNETQSGFLSPRARAVLVTYGLALLGFALGVGVIVVLTIGYFAYTGNQTVSSVAELGMSLIALQGIAFPVLSLIYVRYSGHDWSFLNVKTPSLKQVGWAVLTFVGAFLLAIVAAIVVPALAHGLYDAALFAILYLATAYGTQTPTRRTPRPTDTARPRRSTTPSARSPPTSPSA